MRNALLAVLLFASVASGQDKDTIRFPVQAAAPTAVVSKLTASTFYVIDSDVPILVTSSPLGIVSITEEAGPIKVRGVFADGNGKIETRTYRGKQVFFIEATATGQCEILVIPQGAKSASDIIRRQLDVDAGQGPRPPPDPKPDPKPNPPGPVTPQKLWIVVIEETADATIARSLFFKDKDIANRIADKGHRKRVFDKDSVDASGKQPAWMTSYISRAKTLPYVILTNMDADRIIFEGPLPQSKSDFLKMLEKAGG